MPRLSTTVSVFLASPSDVQHERDLIASVTTRWNMRNGRAKAMFIELLRYETSVSAGFGEDGQAVINEQIGEEYDALIAVFWNRIGTATTRSSSGSVEEIEKAIERFRNGGNVEVAVYFKQGAVNVDSLDLDQIQGVRDLKKRLEGEGSLYKTFTNDDQLTLEIEMLFDRLARQFSNEDLHKKSNLSSQTTTDSAIVRIGSITEDEEPGLFDVIESLEKHASSSTLFITQLGTELNKLAEKTGVQTSLIEDAARLGPLQATDVKPSISAISKAMDNFSNFVEVGIEEYQKGIRGIGEAIRQIVDLSSDFSQSEEDKTQTFSMINSLISSAEGGRQGLVSLTNTTSTLPRMTTEFNKARRRLLINLGLVNKEISEMIEMLDSSLDELNSSKRLDHSYSKTLQ